MWQSTCTARSCTCRGRCMQHAGAQSFPVYRTQVGRSSVAPKPLPHKHHIIEPRMHPRRGGWRGDLAAAGGQGARPVGHDGQVCGSGPCGTAQQPLAAAGLF